MADLPYNYTIRIQSNGSSDPSASPSNQWQRKLNGQPNFVDIAGKTSTTYTVDTSDQSASIRLKQTFNGAPAYSNVLKVTDDSPSAWVFKGTLLSGQVNALSYATDDGSLAVAGRDGAGKISYDGGNTWSNWTHGLQVPISMQSLDNNRKYIYGGYGGSTADDNVYYKNNTSGNMIGGFPRNTFIYGAVQLKDNTLLASDGNGYLWTSPSISGPFTKYATRVDTNSIKIQGDADHQDWFHWGSGYRTVWKFHGTSGSTPIYEKTLLPFNTTTSNGSVSNVAMDGKGNYLVGASDAQMFRSSNGRDWTRIESLRSHMPYSASVTAVSYGRGRWWAAAGYTGTLYLFSSTDAINWSPAPLPDGLTGWNSPKMLGVWGNDVALWTFSDSYLNNTYYCIFG